MSYTIFSIDNVTDTHTLSKFLRMVDTKQAMGKMRGTMKTMVGAWEGKLEYSFIVDSVDFDFFIFMSGYVSEQETFLHVSRDKKMVATLEVRLTGARGKVGNMVEVTKEEAMSSDGWSYRPDLDKYWIIK